MLQVLTGHAELKALAGPWEALAERFDNPLLRHDCVVTCATAYSHCYKLAVFTVWRGRELAAAAPFRVVSRAGVPRLEAATRMLGEPDGWLHADEAALEELVDGILAHGKPLMLGRMAVDGPEARLLEAKLARRRGFGRTDFKSSSVWVPLRPDWAAFEAAMSSGRRSYIRRKGRRAERFGPVTFEAHSPGEAEAPELLERAYGVEAASWKGRNGTAILMKPQSRQFFTDYGVALARRGRLRVYFLRIGGELAAMRIAAAQGGRIWELKIGYDEKFYDCSPGVLLTHETLRHSCETGCAGFEFLGQTEPWESHWTDQARDYVSLNIHPFSPLGALSRAQDEGWALVKAALRRLRLDKGAWKERSRKASAAAAGEGSEA